jgi:hypothetical protein
MDTTKHAEQIIWLAGKRHVICVGGRVALMGRSFDGKQRTLQAVSLAVGKLD